MTVPFSFNFCFFIQVYQGVNSFSLFMGLSENGRTVFKG